VSSGLLKNFETATVNLSFAVFDLNQIVEDLIDLRCAVAESQEKFSKLSGLDEGKIQRIESRANKSGPPVEDMQQWLLACGSSLTIYFGQLKMTNDLEVLNEDAEIAEMFKKALKIPAKRQMLKLYLEGLVVDERKRAEKQRGKSRQRQPG